MFLAPFRCLHVCFWARNTWPLPCAGIGKLRMPPHSHFLPLALVVRQKILRVLCCCAKLICNVGTGSCWGPFFCATALHACTSSNLDCGRRTVFSFHCRRPLVSFLVYAAASWRVPQAHLGCSMRHDSVEATIWSAGAVSEIALPLSRPVACGSVGMFRRGYVFGFRFLQVVRSMLQMHTMCSLHRDPILCALSGLTLCVHSLLPRQYSIRVCAPIRPTTKKSMHTHAHTDTHHLCYTQLSFYSVQNLCGS